MTIPRRIALLQSPSDLATLPLAVQKAVRHLNLSLDWCFEQVTSEFRRVLRITQVGVATISGVATTVSVTLVTAEPDTAYTVLVTPTAQTGAPAAGANRVVSVAKTTTAITVMVEAAPGVGNSVSLDWAIVRNLVS